MKALGDDKDRLGEQRSQSGLPQECQNIKQQDWQDTHTRAGAHTHTHTQSPRPPTHGYAFLCLSISPSTLLAYSSALSIPSSNSSSLTSIPRLSGRTWLLLEAATAFFIYLFSCLRAIVLKAQQTMRWTNGRLAFV